MEMADSNERERHPWIAVIVAIISGIAMIFAAAIQIAKAPSSSLSTTWTAKT